MKTITPHYVTPLCALLFAIPLSTFAVDELPKSFAFQRYQGMMDHSPFAVATAVAPPVAAPNFAKDLFIANAAHAREGDMVTVASSTDKMFKKYLTTGAPVDGYSITSIEWSDKVGATKVTISKDGQTATLGFNEALLKQPGGGGPPGGNTAAVPPPAFQPPSSVPQNSAEKEKMMSESKSGGAMPMSNAVAAPPTNPAGALQNQNPAAKPMPVPMVPTPQPRVRGVIPRNPGSH